MVKKVESTSNHVMNLSTNHKNKHDPSPEEIRREARLIRIENNERDGIVEADYQREPYETQLPENRPD